jgi:hypothetical protein
LNPGVIERSDKPRPELLLKETPVVIQPDEIVYLLPPNRYPFQLKKINQLSNRSNLPKRIPLQDISNVKNASNTVFPDNKRTRQMSEKDVKPLYSPQVQQIKLILPQLQEEYPYSIETLLTL